MYKYISYINILIQLYKAQCQKSITNILYIY
nr:MAG TPA: hypothetical protein [Bacteriophage sp.]